MVNGWLGHNVAVGLNVNTRRQLAAAAFYSLGIDPDQVVPPVAAALCGSLRQRPVGMYQRIPAQMPEVARVYVKRHTTGITHRQPDIGCRPLAPPAADRHLVRAGLGRTVCGQRMLAGRPAVGVAAGADTCADAVQRQDAKAAKCVFQGSIQ